MGGRHFGAEWSHVALLRTYAHFTDDGLVEEKSEMVSTMHPRFNAACLRSVEVLSPRGAVCRGKLVPNQKLSA